MENIFIYRLKIRCNKIIVYFVFPKHDHEKYKTQCKLKVDVHKLNMTDQPLKKLTMRMFIVVLIFFTGEKGFSQKADKDRFPSLLNYGLFIEPYIQALYNTEPLYETDSIINPNTLNISFRIDKMGNIIDYHVKNIILPVRILNTLEKIFLSTNGKWRPQLNNCQPEDSDTLHCYINFTPCDKNSWRYLKAMETRYSDLISLSEGVDESKRYANEICKPNSIQVVICY